MYNKYNISDIEGILYCKDEPLIDFKIVGFRLVYVRDLSNGRKHPCYFRELGLTYTAFNSFFNDRVVRDYAQDLRDYLDFLNLRFYDFNQIVKKMNGWDSLGLYWVKFKDKGAKCWNDILTQKYPIY